MLKPSLSDVNELRDYITRRFEDVHPSPHLLSPGATGIVLLWSEVIVQQLVDLIAPAKDPNAGKSREHRSRLRKRESERNAAKAWFFSPRHTDDFTEVCKYAAIPPATVRGLAQDLMEAIHA